jgi:DNA-binding PadR family transcriptional regulator
MNDPARLSRTERLILDLLQDGESFGLELVMRSRAALKRGTVYVTLARMEEKGYVTSRTEPLPHGAIGLPRRLYRPTAYGVSVLKIWTRAERALKRLRTQEA